MFPSVTRFPGTRTLNPALSRTRVPSGCPSLRPACGTSRQPLCPRPKCGSIVKGSDRRSPVIEGCLFSCTWLKRMSVQGGSLRGLQEERGAWGRAEGLEGLGCGSDPYQLHQGKQLSSGNTYQELTDARLASEGGGGGSQLKHQKRTIPGSCRGRGRGGHGGREARLASASWRGCSAPGGRGQANRPVNKHDSFGRQSVSKGK